MLLHEHVDIAQVDGTFDSNITICQSVQLICCALTKYSKRIVCRYQHRSTCQ